MVKRIIAAIVVVAIISGGYAGIHKFQSIVAAKRAFDAAAANLKRTDIKITITEGKRREEIAAQLEATGITKASDFLAATKTSEGTLFPDTYRFFPNTPASEVASTMETNYATRTKSLNPTRDQLILASIVEREAANDADRPNIAGVYANRLKVGMFMGSDPTVEYAKDTLAYTKNPSVTFSFWGPITQADYKNVESPYNTYLHLGLPPGPVCNPGLKSIAAAISPASNPYYYFLYDSAGVLQMSKTLQQHVQKSQ
jgi:UPF0755 protein